MKKSGFTLIELMVTVAIIGILSSLAMPNFAGAIVRAQISEGMSLIKPVNESVLEYYRLNRKFPRDNAAAGLPAPDKIMGNYVSSVTVENGAVHIVFGHHVHLAVADKTLSLRPQLVEGSPASPVSWQCGQRQAPAGMQATGTNRTDVPTGFLPLRCM